MACHAGARSESQTDLAADASDGTGGRLPEAEAEPTGRGPQGLPVPAVEPDPDALYHAGDLHLLRSHRTSLDERAEGDRERRRGASGGGRMNISAPFIRRPVATTLLTAGV